MKKRLLCLILACLLLTTGVLAYGSGTGEAVYVNRWSLASGFTRTTPPAAGTRPSSLKTSPAAPSTP